MVNLANYNILRIASKKFSAISIIVESFTCLYIKNSQVKLCAGQQHKLEAIDDFKLIGFTLPNTSVTSKTIPTESDVIFGNLYSSTSCLLFMVGFSLFAVWYYQKSLQNEEFKNSHMKSFSKWKFKHNKNVLYRALVRTLVLALILEFCSRVASCIVWTVHVNESPSTFLAVWLPQLWLLFAYMYVIFFMVFYTYKSVHYNKLYNIRVLYHFLILCLSIFMFCYLLFPSTILMFVYPTEMIAIFTFILAYLFATTVILAGLDKIRESSHPNEGHNLMVNHYRCLSKGCVTKYVSQYIPFVIVLYLLLIVLIILYTLLIGNSAAASSGPLFIITLFPSAFMSGTALIFKRIAFRDDEDQEKLVRNFQMHYVTDEAQMHYMEGAQNDQKAQIHDEIEAAQIHSKEADVEQAEENGSTGSLYQCEVETAA